MLTNHKYSGIFYCNQASVSLEQHLGDPYDEREIFSYSRILADDEQGILSKETEKSLDRWGLSHYFVPSELGGKLNRYDVMVEVLRCVFRRDMTLGLGYGVTSFMAAVNVWTNGNEEQKKQLANLLLDHQKVSVAYHELAHGNDFVHNELKACQQENHFQLVGKKEIINNIERAKAIVLFAKTSETPGSRSHSLFLIEKEKLAQTSYRYLPRFSTVGVKGCQIAGIDFQGTLIPSSSLLGKLGSGVETALKAFQITRTILPAISVASGDTALRTVLNFAVQRQLYHHSVVDIPHARSTLVNAFLDLQIADCLSLSITRALHVLPGQMSIYSATAKYFIPYTIKKVLNNLSLILGARFYLREGETAIFQKLLRDYPVVSVGHAGLIICQASILPQLPFLAQKSWTGINYPKKDWADIYRFDSDLPTFQSKQLKITNNGHDDIIKSLNLLLSPPDELKSSLGLHRLSDEMLSLVEAINDQLAVLTEDVQTLHQISPNPLSDPKGFALVEKYSIIIAAITCINTYLYNPQLSLPFFQAGTWLVASLKRLLSQLSPETFQFVLEPVCEEELLSEMLDRLQQGKHFTLIP
jgi:alkylation response protein AidB-like acyl-CoA dehydrogenase